MSVSTGPDHAARIFVAYLRQMRQHRVAVFGCNECSDFDAVELVRAFNAEHGTRYQAHQVGKVGSAESGTVRVVDLDRVAGGDVDTLLGSPASGEGRGMRARTILRERLTFDAGTPWVWSLPTAFGHAAPSWAPRARRSFMRVWAGLSGLRLGDLNLVARVAARMLPGTRVVGVGVLNAGVPSWIPCSRPRAIPKDELAGADHAGVLFTLWPAPGR